MKRWPWRTASRAWWLALLSLTGGLLLAQTDTGFDELAADVAAYQRDLAYRLEAPMAAGLDVSEPLEKWFEAEKPDLEGGMKRRAELYREAFASLKRALRPLPQADWPKVPTDVELEFLEQVRIAPMLFEYTGLKPLEGVECRIVRFEVDDLKQYGVVLRPTAEGKYPLLVFCHGAAFGVPTTSLPWLARLAASGYVVAAPSMRGEDLFTSAELLGLEQRYRSEGKIENLVGEVNDVLAMADGALRLDYVAGPRYAIVGHSFGSGAGLLAGARDERVACMVSYDAWLVNPFRFYWERLRGGSRYYWESWEEYTRQPVAAQLAGLMERSIVHHADRVQSPVLLFVGGAYNGSAYHDCHAELAAALKKAGKTFVYEIIPGGSHNFVLYPDSEPAKTAYAMQMAWLQKYHPPADADAPEPEPAGGAE